MRAQSCLKIKFTLVAVSGVFCFVTPSAIAALLISGAPVTLNFDNLNTSFGGAYNSTGGASTFPAVVLGTTPITIYSASSASSSAAGKILPLR
jgi:hypothetical protein